jgi:hypothetical protein
VVEIGQIANIRKNSGTVSHRDSLLLTDFNRRFLALLLFCFGFEVVADFFLCVVLFFAVRFCAFLPLRLKFKTMIEISDAKVFVKIFCRQPK